MSGGRAAAAAGGARMSVDKLWHVKKRVEVGRSIAHGHLDTLRYPKVKPDFSQPLESEKNPKLVQADGPQILADLRRLTIKNQLQRSDELWRRAVQQNAIPDVRDQAKYMREILNMMVYRYRLYSLEELEAKYHEYVRRFGLDGEVLGIMLCLVNRKRDDPELRERYFPLLDRLPNAEKVKALRRYIARLVRSRHWESVEEVASMAQGWDPVLINTVLEEGRKQKRHEEALAAYEHLRKAHGTGNQTTFSHLIVLYTVLKEHKVVSGIFATCVKREISLDIDALLCASMSMVEIGRLDWEHYCLQKVKMRLHSSRSKQAWERALRYLVLLGKYNEAHQLFLEMPRREIAATGSAFHSATRALYGIGKFEKALALAARMRDQNKSMFPGLRKMLTLCDGCVDGGEVVHDEVPF